MRESASRIDPISRKQIAYSRDRFEFRYTPQRGSWLNMAEIEIGAMSRQCPKRRIPDRETMRREAAAFVTTRNVKAKTVNWRFTAQDARFEFKSLYPSFQKC
ncbi:MAG: transposase [Albidovulum sp.]|nr:transposase [Albidovulum sp.]